MNQAAIERIRQEFEIIKAQNAEGKIKVRDVVEFAKNPQTELHKHFTWDTDKAAYRYWLEQARSIIQEVKVTVQHNESPIADTRIIVSLHPDRKVDGGGYRMLQDVLSDEDLYRQYVETALMEMTTLKRKYESVRELRPIFTRATEEIETLVRRTASKSPVKASEKKKHTTAVA